jgi:hypothetical protein
MQPPVRIPVHLGSGEQGERRKVALQRLAERAGFVRDGVGNISAWLVSLADAEGVDLSLPDGVPAFSPRLSLSWLRQLPSEIPVWGVWEGETRKGWLASLKRPAGSIEPDAYTAADWIEHVEERYGE